jgi:hypothetical protein
VRGTVVTAIKYTFIDQAQHYDELLNPIIVEFLSLIKDEDLVCTRVEYVSDFADDFEPLFLSRMFVDCRFRL